MYGLALGWGGCLLVCDAGTLDISWIRSSYNVAAALLVPARKRCTYSPDIVHVGHALKIHVTLKTRSGRLGIIKHEGRRKRKRKENKRKEG
jgi:hypothetical protein